MKKNNTAVILHSIEDAKHYFDDFHHEHKTEHQLFVTHAGVGEYIKNSYKSKATILSLFLTYEDAAELKKASYSYSDKLLQELDREYQHFLQHENFNIDFFDTLYSAHLPFFTTGCLSVLKSINVLNHLHQIDQFIIYNYQSSLIHTLDLKSTLEYAITQAQLAVEWRFSIANTIPKTSPLKKIQNLIIKLYNNKQKALNIAIDTIYEFVSYFFSKKRAILYMDNLYDLTFIKRSNKFKLVAYGYQSLKQKFLFHRQNKRPQIHCPSYTHTNDSMDESIKYLIVEHLKYYITDYLNGLSDLEQCIQDNKIELAIWGNSPSCGFKSLFYAYCLENNIPVVGMQHGASYIDQNYIDHWYLDFKRCNYFFSYGFDQTDYENSINYKGIPKAIIPVGSTKNYKFSTSSKQVDILFPITNTITMIEGGMHRVKPDIMHDDQMNLLNYLEEKSHLLNTIVKPFKNTNIVQTSVYTTLQKAQNYTVEWSMTFEESLKKYRPRCIVIDFMSTPLYECINLDVDIFLFVRPMDNLTEKARNMLEKRVYIVASFSEFKILFDDCVAGNLPQKRDMSYYNYYIYQEKNQEKILSSLSKLSSAIRKAH